MLNMLCAGLNFRRIKLILFSVPYSSIYEYAFLIEYIGIGFKRYRLGKEK